MFSFMSKSEELQHVINFRKNIVSLIVVSYLRFFLICIKHFLSCFFFKMIYQEFISKKRFAWSETSEPSIIQVNTCIYRNPPWLGHDTWQDPKKRYTNIIKNIYRTGRVIYEEVYHARRREFDPRRKELSDCFCSSMRNIKHVS